MTWSLVTIYGLRASNDGRIRYVGQTTRSLEWRLSRHIIDSKGFKNRRICKWINSVYKSGESVIAFVIEKNAIKHDAEIRLIKWYREHGATLVNGTDGGDGLNNDADSQERSRLARIERWSRIPKKGPSIEARAKLSLAMKGGRNDGLISYWQGRRGEKSPWTRPPVTEETRLKLSLAAKGRLPTNLSQIHASMIGKPKPESTRMKIASTLTGRKQSAQTLEKRAASMRATLAAKRANHVVR